MSGSRLRVEEVGVFEAVSEKNLPLISIIVSYIVVGATGVA